MYVTDLGHIFIYINYVVLFRNCGKVFCSECTRFAIPVSQQQLNVSVRVCRNCYQISNFRRKEEARKAGGAIAGLNNRSLQ